LLHIPVCKLARTRIYGDEIFTYEPDELEKNGTDTTNQLVHDFTVSRNHGDINSMQGKLTI